MNKTTKFQKKILTWYSRNRRDLPWRRTQDPYHILVSEFMLQQTQVQRVLVKYASFLHRFPTIGELARASRADVITEWSGLGYNRRAIFLHECAKGIVSKFKGEFPRDPAVLLELPGIGPYMSRAVLIFAFNEQLAAVDTNVRRILIDEGFAKETTSIQELHAIALLLVPQGRARDWHNALMDYGASIKTSRATGIKPLTRQSQFLHSFRWYRSKVVKFLIKNKKSSAAQLEKILNKDKSFVKKVVDSLKKDQLVEVKKNKITLPQ